MDDVAAIIATQGQGAMLAKIDIEAAYRLIPMHPDDRHLQAVCWEGHVYMDLMLPFGLRSAPKIFNAVADALNWHLEREGIGNIRHYLRRLHNSRPTDVAHLPTPPRHTK